jgi:acetoin utilization deacetylase AcuC-like enzyme
MKVFYCDQYPFSLPEGHRFPLEKFRLLRERIVAEGIIREADLCAPAAITVEQLCRAHEADYVEKVFTGQLTPQEVKRLGFPWSPELVERARRSTGATLGVCRAALGDGIAASLAGGTHHAGHRHGEGFCVFNDGAVAARTLQSEGLVKRVVILDCDVHQGNGTAEILDGDESIFTFSIHGEKNFPLRKYPSDLDVGLPDGTEDVAYLAALEKGLATALERARADFAIYIAGADPYRDDRLGRLALTFAGLAERDRLVLETCRRLGLPVAITMAGGYARNILDTVAIQARTIQLAAELCSTVG